MKRNKNQLNKRD